LIGNNYELQKAEYKREEKETMNARNTNRNVMRLKFCISFLYQAITILIESNGKERLVLSYMSHFYDEFMLKRHTSKLRIWTGTHQHGEVDIGDHARSWKTSTLKLQDAVLDILHTGIAHCAVF
jgi:hypothetical protein